MEYYGWAVILESESRAGHISTLEFPCLRLFVGGKSVRAEAAWGRKLYKQRRKVAIIPASLMN